MKRKETLNNKSFISFILCVRAGRADRGDNERETEPQMKSLSGEMR